MKSRLDWMDVERSIVIDLKTTRDACEFDFARSAARYEYHTRAAFYSDAYLAKFGVRPRFVLVAVEKVPPYAVAVYRVGEDLLHAGRRRYEALLARLVTCRERDEWPGICDDRELELALPPWTPGLDDELEVNTCARS